MKYYKFKANVLCVQLTLRVKRTLKAGAAHSALRYGVIALLD